MSKDRLAGFEWFLITVLMCVFLAFVMAVVNQDGYHRDWCKARMAEASTADTVAVLRDDEFCARVIAP